MNVKCPADYLEYMKCQDMFNVPLNPIPIHQKANSWWITKGYLCWILFTVLQPAVRQQWLHSPAPSAPSFSTWHNFRDQKQRTRLEWELTLAWPGAFSTLPPLILGLTTDCPNKTVGAPNLFIPVRAGGANRPENWGPLCPLSPTAWGLEPTLHSCFSDQVGYLDTVPASNRAPIVQPSQPHRGTLPAKSKGPTQILAAERDSPTFKLEAQLPSPTWPVAHLALRAHKILKSPALLFVKGREAGLGKQMKLKLTLCPWPWRCYRHYHY